ncbi:MAG: FliH/SctL family protein [Terracidiphilus sp.]|nr:FliH/SctL family protein [Terracidiphilus sp.]
MSIEVFEYPADPNAPALPEWNGWADEAQTSTREEPAHAHAKEAREASVSAEQQQRLAEETRRSFEAGRERGRQEGRQVERETQAAAQVGAEQRRVQQAAALIESFAEERDRYLQAVEHEVVELALAVAARILRREAQMDPLLLTGAVRVALGQLSGSTEVRLRVPAADLDLWTEAVALLPNLALKPALAAGEGMRLGDCVIETALGSVDLGIRAQLGEIERGFFDRAGGHRAAPAGTPDKMPGAGVEAGS